MAVHAMAKAELDGIERAEQSEQARLRATLEQPLTGWPPSLRRATTIVAAVESDVGPLAEALSRATAPVELLWHRLFTGADAYYLRLLHAVRLADGFAAWPDPPEMAIGGPDGPVGSTPALLAEHAGRSAVLAAWWQDGAAGQALARAQRRVREHYGLGGEDEQVALASARRADLLLAGGWGATVELAPDYYQRLAVHHRVRMVFVELAGLSLLAHLLDDGGLARLDPAVLRDRLPEALPAAGPGDLARSETRWALYRWLARAIQQGYADDPDAVFVDNEASLRGDPRRAMIADMVNGPFFTRDARLARDQSNLHWSRDGLGRDEENSFFHVGFTQGVFRSAKTMVDQLSLSVACVVAASGHTPTYLYDGATGSGAVPRTVLEVMARIAPDVAGSLRWQLTDVSAASLQAAWTACAGRPELCLSWADLAAPVITPADHGTFDVAGQNLGAHHLPDDEYAAMIRGLVALTRPGGLIYLGDVDERIGLQLFNGLWANLYAVEWPRVSSDPYRMFARPSTLTVACQPIDYCRLGDTPDAAPPGDRVDAYKMMVMRPDMARAFPRDLAFYTMGLGYVSVVDQAQLDAIDALAEQGRDWHGVLVQDGSRSARLARDQDALAERVQVLLHAW